MERQAVIKQKNNVCCRVKDKFLFAIEHHFALLPYLLHPGCDLVHIKCYRIFAAQAQYNGNISAMPLAGLGERTI